MDVTLLYSFLYLPVCQLSDAGNENMYMCRPFFTHIHTGGGIYVANSEYYKNKSVPNNDLTVVDYSCYHYCRKIDIYCYSNTSSSYGYINFPNGDSTNDNSYFYGMVVSSLSASGIRTRNYEGYDPDLWGVYTCQIPDSQGRTLKMNIGIYSSMPGMCKCVCMMTGLCKLESFLQ